MTRTHATTRRATPRSRRTLQPRAESLEGRLLLNTGDFDPTFGSGGYVLTNIPVKKPYSPIDRAFAVQIQPDGKILAAGSSGGASQPITVMRLNPNGTLDVAFGAGGFAQPLANA